MTTILDTLKVTFRDVFHEEAESTFFSPGRINLIGEHTDYNGGYVFPCAIAMGTYACVRRREDRLLRLYSDNFADEGVFELSLDNLLYRKEDGWTNYVKGMFLYMSEVIGSLPFGLDIAIVGNIPNGAGLSSSASLEMLIGVIANDLYHGLISAIDLVKLGKRVENDFIGVNSGIMDQFAVAMGQQDHAILLDCHTLDYRLVPLELHDAIIVIMNTNKRRELADSKYNDRFRETRLALAELQAVRPLTALCELTPDEFDVLKSHLSSDTLVKRARHAVTENARTLQAVTALEHGDLLQFGQLMNASHLSAEQDYDITGLELDTLVHTAWKQEGVIGARMTGAGFGGCAIAIVKREAVNHFIEVVGKTYTDIVGYSPSFYLTSVSDGAINNKEAHV